MISTPALHCSEDSCLQHVWHASGCHIGAYPAVLFSCLKSSPFEARMKLSHSWQDHAMALRKIQRPFGALNAFKQCHSKKVRCCCRRLYHHTASAGLTILKGSNRRVVVAYSVKLGQGCAAQDLCNRLSHCQLQRGSCVSSSCASLELLCWYQFVGNCRTLPDR